MRLCLQEGVPCQRYCFSLFLLLFSFLPPVFGQKYFFDNYSVTDGLANAKVRCAIQNTDQRIWLATPSGICIFDGVTFQLKNSKDGLAANDISKLFKDSKGNIWAGHYDGGVTLYNGAKFQHVSALSDLKNVTSFCEDSKGRIWIGCDGSSVIRVNIPDDGSLNKLKCDFFKGKGISDRVFDCKVLSDDRVYVVTDAGIRVYNEKANSFDNFFIEKMPTYFLITSLFEDKNKNLWLGTFHGGLYCYQQKEKQFKIYDIRDGLASNWITSIYQSKDGGMWISTSGGVTRIKGNELTVFNSKNGLAGDFTYGIMQGAESEILIATDAGLSIYKGDITYFNGPEMLPNPMVNCILKDSKGKVWLGTDKGISMFDPLYKFRFYTEKEFVLSSSPKIRFLKEDSRNNIWIGTDDNLIGVMVLNTKTGLIGVSTDIFEQLSIVKRVSGMDISPDGTLWVGSNDRLLAYNILSGEIHAYDQGFGLIGSDISTVYVDKKTNMKYIGSSGKGLTIFKDVPSQKSVRDTLLGGTTPNCIISGPDGILWIATEGQGLIGYRDGKILYRFGTDNGLLSDQVNFVETDDQGFVYAGTTRGLNKIDIKTGIIQTFTKRNGFVGIQANKNAVFKTTEGGLWFGTVDGAVFYDPKKDNLPVSKPVVHFDRFRVNLDDRPVESGTKLSYRENFIAFDYSCISLINPEAVHYQVMLEGVDKDWQPATVETFQKYPALPTGNYVFKVKAQNSFGIWSEPALFEFSISPPFYKTWWFITLCILAGIVSLYFYIKVRERTLIKEKQVLEEKVRERTAEVVAANNQLAMKNKDIMDSILYASRIQNALLPPKIPIENTFVMFRPKDIVSGDFFWFYSGDGIDCIAAVDCTGHGVPGAFMSIIGHNSLNKIIKELHITRPSEILQRLDLEVSKTLHQYNSQVLDGMDIALVCFYHDERRLEYAGAFNPLWLVRNKGLMEIRGNRFPIGLSYDIDKVFENHEVKIEPGDTIYLFSDGYADQFGGGNGKKLKVANFKNIILQLQDNSMNKQLQSLENAFDSWKGDYEQIDDVLVIGWMFS